MITDREKIETLAKAAGTLTHRLKRHSTIGPRKFTWTDNGEIEGIYERSMLGHWVCVSKSKDEK